MTTVFVRNRAIELSLPLNSDVCDSTKKGGGGYGIAVGVNVRNKVNTSSFMPSKKTLVKCLIIIINIGD